MTKPRLRWDEPFGLEGFWWRPEEAGDAKRHGTLRFQPETGIELVVFDLFEEFEPPERLTALYGETLGGTPCTLLNGVVSRHALHPSGGHSESVVRAHEFLRGVHVDLADDLASRRFKARALSLREWLAAPFRKGSEVVPGYGAPGQPDTLPVALPGGQVEFVLGQRQQPGALASSTEVYASARFEFDEEVSLQSFLTEWLGPLLDFLVFATRQPSAVQELTAELCVEGGENAVGRVVSHGTDPEIWRRWPVDVVRTPSVRPAPPPQRAYERILLPASALGESAASLLQRWYELHSDLRAVASYFFGGLAGGRADLRRRALDLMSFAEAYHRAKHGRAPLAPELHRQLTRDMLATVEDPEHRALYERRLGHANEQSQKERVADLFVRAQEQVPDMDLEAEVLPRALVDTRNHFTHWSGRSRHVLDDEGLFWAVKKLTLVLQVNLLLDLGLDPELVETLVQASYAGQRL